ncbi:hypothetical protein B0H21DRAFT_764956, partial [Amylocystis lapponica]
MVKHRTHLTMLTIPIRVQQGADFDTILCWKTSDFSFHVLSMPRHMRSHTLGLDSTITSQSARARLPDTSTAYATLPLLWMTFRPRHPRKGSPAQLGHPLADFRPKLRFLPNQPIAQAACSATPPQLVRPQLHFRSFKINASAASLVGWPLTAVSRAQLEHLAFYILDGPGPSTLQYAGGLIDTVGPTQQHCTLGLALSCTGLTGHALCPLISPFPHSL